MLDEVKRNRPDGVTAERIDARFAQMNKVFPAAMTSGYDALVARMRADEKDKHVLAAAVQCRSTVLVTENVKDFDPPSQGAYAIQVVRTSDFLNRLLAERPERVLAALQAMLRRNRREPRSMPELLDTMATRSDLKGFAQRLNLVAGPEQRGSHPSLRGDVAAAFEGLAPADEASQAPTSTPVARKAKQQNTEKGRDAERDL